MPPPRKRRRKRQYYKGAVIQGQRAILTNNRQVALNLARARKMGGGGGSSGGGGGSSGGGGGGGDLGARLREAAEVIAQQARSNAGGWSARIPPSIRVSGGASGVSILSGAPPAYPNEVAGVRHPVFGGRGTRRPKAPWVLNQHRPFLAPAADQKGDAAAQAFSKVIDDWAHEHGYRGRLRVKIDYDGRIWDFDLEEMTVPECEAVEKYVGKGLGEWANQMGAGSVKAVVALWWVLRSQAGEPVERDVTVPAGFRPVKLLSAFHAADAAAAVPEEAEADPTKRTGGSPAPAPDPAAGSGPPPG